MSFRFTADQLRRSQIVIADEPDYIVPLPIAPPSIEDCLKHGDWLVVNMSVWSVHDVRNGVSTVEVVKRHEGLVKLGLRPFDEFSEFQTWIPPDKFDKPVEKVEVSFQEGNEMRSISIQGRRKASPVWVVISGGEILAVRSGQFDASEIHNLVLLCRPGDPGRAR